LTVEAVKAIEAAKPLYLRTRRHPVVAELGDVELVSFDDLYDSEEDFDSVYNGIVTRLLEAEGKGDVTYAVPGHPLFGEATVRMLLEQADEVRIIDGVSFIEPACRLLGVDPLESGLQLLDALNLAVIDPSRPVLAGQVYNRRAASELKLATLRWYPEGHGVTVLNDLSMPTERSREVKLGALDHEDDFDHLTTVFFPALELERNTQTFGGLRAIVDHLRSPHGCPWDREQTHESLRSDLLEETYEVLAALDAADQHALREELGDLLNQVVFQARIAEEAGDFDLEDVIESVATKLVRRHPHVFSGLEVSGTADVLRNWEAIKRDEKDGAGEDSALSGVSPTLPALHQAALVLERASRAGFRWQAIDDILDKITEEVDELRGAESRREKEAEFGDILFNLVNAARYMELDAESALRHSTSKFRARFAEVERLAAERKLDMHETDVDTLLRLWQEARNAADFQSGAG
jgi:tetrapyrrole methylase family protein/MazG family protein